MTHVIFRLSQRGGYRGYTAEGHAETVGQDEYSAVCAAVSALTITGVNALEKVAGVHPVAEARDGQLACFLPPDLDDAAWERAQIILRTVETGLTDIQRQYSEYVRIEVQ